MTTEERRSNNIHSIAELQNDGNYLLYLDAVQGNMSMKRGKTITFYSSKDGFYWTPTEARTL